MNLVKCDVCGKVTHRKNLGVSIEDRWIEIRVGVGNYYSTADIANLGPWQICSWQCATQHAERRQGKAVKAKL